MTVIDSLVQKYLEGGLKDEVKRDLASLMEYEEIDKLGFRTYTPSFNDGDICEYTLEFLDKLNHTVSDGDYAILAGEDNTLEVDSPKYPEPVYKVGRQWHSLVAEIAPLFLDTNTEGLIVYSTPYDYDY